MVKNFLGGGGMASGGGCPWIPIRFLVFDDGDDWICISLLVSHHRFLPVGSSQLYWRLILSSRVALEIR